MKVSSESSDLNAESGNGAEGGHGCKLAMAAMKSQKLANINVTYSVAVRHHEGVIRKMLSDALQSSSGKGVRTGVGARNRELLFGMLTVVIDPRLTAKANGEIVVHRLVVQEVFLDHVAAVAEAEHELTEAVVGVRLHDVPKDRASAHVDQRFGPKFGFFAEAGAQASTQNDDFHRISSIGDQRYSWLVAPSDICDNITLTFPQFRLADLQLPSNARSSIIPLAQRPPKAPRTAFPSLFHPLGLAQRVPRNALTKDSLLYFLKNQRHTSGNRRFPGFALLP